MSRRDALTAAVQAADLPALLAEFHPDSKAKPGKAGVYFASWRGNENTPALSVNRNGGRWLWKDQATGDGGNAFDYLVGIVGMTKQEAAELLLQKAGIPSEPVDNENDFKPIPKSSYEVFLRGETARIAAMAGRGFNKRLLREYQIVPAPDNPDDALIPITSPEGVILQVKRRFAEEKKRGMKYTYEHSGYGGPAWCSSNSRQASDLYIIEGELNAIIAHAALTEAGENIGVMGVAGANNAIFDGLARGKHVFVYADDDKSGREAVDRWVSEAREEGARSVHRLPAGAMDFCDYAGAYGRSALANHLQEMRRNSRQVFGVEDRMVGRYSVRDLVRSAKRYISGEVIHSTGIEAIDKETGGIRETGLYGVAGLSSMGKSSFARRILLEEVRRGGTVRLYSPDQSPHAIYRLLASLLSDVGPKEIRTGQLSASAQRRYGDVVAARLAWTKLYQHVITEVSSRFQVSEAGNIREISKDMRRAVDQGVTMFGVDYIQMLEPEGRDTSDGVAAMQLQEVASEVGRPVITAMQLAKYKFPATRLDARPNLNDIQGAGAYHQACEMVFMVFNDNIYERKYGGPDYVPLHDPPDVSRILLRKDKEGEGELDFQAKWIARLAAFKDPQKPSLNEEQKGLLWLPS